MTEAIRDAVRAICPHAKWCGCLTDTCKYQERGNECFRDAEIAKNIIEALEPHFAAREAAAVAAAVLERDELIERFGDAVTDMFDQMLKGKWRDDHDHDVPNNKMMIDLKTVVEAAIELRARSTQESGR